MIMPKESFWVIDKSKNKPVFVEGEICEEEQEAWCAGVKYFRLSDDNYYNWFNSEREALEFQIQNIDRDIEYANYEFQQTVKYAEQELKEKIEEYKTHQEACKKQLETLLKNINSP
jgi:hypothetical protein